MRQNRAKRLQEHETRLATPLKVAPSVRGPRFLRTPGNESVWTTMKSLQMVTALVEAGAGLALAGFPSLTAWLLLGTPLESAAALIMARIGGAAILTVAVICWQNAYSLASRDFIVALLFYNATVATLLSFASVFDELHGILLWPAVTFHLAMGAWCIATLLRKDEAALR